MGHEQEKQSEQHADELDREADALGHDSEALEEKVIEVRREWDRKREDPKVPGARPPRRRTSR